MLFGGTLKVEAEHSHCSPWVHWILFQSKGVCIESFFKAKGYVWLMKANLMGNPHSVSPGCFLFMLFPRSTTLPLQAAPVCCCRNVQRALGTVQRLLTITQTVAAIVTWHSCQGTREEKQTVRVASPHHHQPWPAASKWAAHQKGQSSVRFASWA